MGKRVAREIWEYDTLAEFEADGGAAAYDAGLVRIAGQDYRINDIGGLAAAIKTLSVDNVANLPPASEFAGVAQIGSELLPNLKLRNQLDLARRRVNLLNLKDISYIQKYEITGGTATPDVSDNSITFAVPADTAGRTYFQFFWLTVTANKRYAISFDVVSTSGSLVSGSTAMFSAIPATCVNEETTSAWDFIDLQPGKKHYSIFRPNLTGTVTFRFGIGPVSAATAGPIGASVKISNICFEELSDSKNLYPALYPVPLKQSVNVIDLSDYVIDAATKTMTGTVKTLPAKSVAIFGDSYVNDDADYPYQLNLLSKIGVWTQYEISTGVTTASKTMSEFLLNFETKIQLLIDGGVAPRYVLLQSSLNTLNDSNPATRPARISESYARLVECINWSLARNITPILTTVAPWKAGAAYWFTAGVYLDQYAWDDAIYALAANYALPVFNLRDVVNDPDDPYSFLAANTTDNIHPNATGVALIVDELEIFIENL
jgi:lysophospholipase L1-like esterase